MSRPTRSNHRRSPLRGSRPALLGLALLVTGCASSGTGLEGLNATLWAQHSAEYRASTEQAFRTATRMLDEAIADPAWTALPEQGDPYGLPPAVILDVDETVLDNSPFQARLIAEGREFNAQMWNAWVEEAAAPPIPGAIAFTHFAAELGVAVFYVSNREAAQEDATVRNLVRAGFPLQGGPDAVLLEGERDGWSSDKASRRAYVAESYRVLLLAGDDLNDFVSVARVTTEERDRLEAAYSAYWGVRWIMLPNPAYGSWERALYDFDSSLSAEEKRDRKQARLKTSGEGGDASPR